MIRGASRDLNSTALREIHVSMVVRDVDDDIERVARVFTLRLARPVNSITGERRGWPSRLDALHHFRRR